MEDFGGIIWTLIVVGFGIYGMIMQARKKQADAGRQQHDHGEAWPSLDSEDEEPQTATEAAAQHEFAPLQSEFEDGTDAEPPYIEQMQAEPAFYDESNYSEAGENALSNKMQSKIVGTSMTENIVSKNTNLAVTNQAEESLQAPEELEFDLRKAVIYSEILKPKFED